MYIYFVNDFYILYIIILSDLFITMIFTYYFLFFQVTSATATRYGLSRGLLGLEYDRINISDSDSDSHFELLCVTPTVRVELRSVFPRLVQSPCSVY